MDDPILSDPAWHQDPLGRYEHRYWDGFVWTAHVSNDGVAELDPLPLPDVTVDQAVAETGQGTAGKKKRKEKRAERKEAKRTSSTEEADVDQRVEEAPVPEEPGEGADPSGVLRGKGVTGRIEVDAHFVTIHRKGFAAKANYGWTRGEKRLPVGSIMAIQFKKPGLSNGYIQFTVAGGMESTRGIMAATKDENTVVFSGSHTGEFEAIRDHLERIIMERHSPVPERSGPPPDLGVQLRDLAALRDEGILTSEEFEVQKARLLQH